MNIKKLFLCLCLTISFWLGYSFSYFENELYCLVDQNTIFVSLQQKLRFKCNDYTTALEQAIKITYSDLIKINTIISRWYDLEYWQPIKDKKLLQFDLQQKMLIKIKTSMKDFESNLLIKFQDFFKYSTKDYKSDLENKYSFMSWRNEPYINWYMSLISSQLENIDWLISAENFKQLFAYSKKYFYIKTQLDEDWNRYFVKW